MQEQNIRPTPAERKKRRRELFLIFAILVLIIALTSAETRIMDFGESISIHSTVMMFILINVNLIGMLALFVLVVRNLVKTVYERKRKIMGSRLRSKLIFSFTILSLLPMTVLFVFALQFITTSMEFWFSVPVEKALVNAIGVRRLFYEQVETGQKPVLARLAGELAGRRPADDGNLSAVKAIAERVRASCGADGVELYDASGRRLFFVGKNDETDLAFPALTAREATGQSQARLLTETGAGELVRTTAGTDAGFVAVGTLLNPDLAKNLASIVEGYSKYQEHGMLKAPMELSLYTSLTIAALVILFCAVWFGIHLARTLTVPISILADGTRQIASGDLSLVLPKLSDDEMGSLVDSFNSMTRDLRMSREQLEYSAHELSDRNVEIEKRRKYMEVVLNNVSAGVVSLDYSGLVSTINKSAERMLGIKARNAVGKSVRSVSEGQSLWLAARAVEELEKKGEDSVKVTVRQNVAGRPRSFMVNATALKDEAGRYMGTVIVADDLTDLERAQRMAAWREVARRVAHEVKNPLTPIKLSAQRMARRFSDEIEDPVFLECTRTIIEQVDLIRNLVDEFSAYARFPAPRPVPSHLPLLVSDALAPYPEGYPAISFEIRVESQEAVPRLLLDPAQIKRVLINLVDNAIAAIGGPGKITVSVCTRPDESLVVLEVADTGKGLTDEEKGRIFEPYFSTKSAGMGLGLSIVAAIIADHNGSIRVTDNEPNGAKFILEFPT